MTLRCKPGDLAIIVSAACDGKFLGRLVEIIQPAPLVHFKLPDGFPHKPSDPEHWVIRFIGTPILARAGESHRLTYFGCGRDSGMRPIRGGEQEQQAENEKELSQ